MARSLQFPRSRYGLADWIGPARRRMAVPSWVLSGLFHVLSVTLLVLISQTSGCQRGLPGEAGDGFREVGVYLTADAPEPSPSPPEPAESAAAARSTSPPAVVPDAPPIEIDLPSRETEPILGIGGEPIFSAGGPPLASSLSQPAPSSGPAAQTPGSPLGGATSMFGITDAGRRFSYVLDHSGSMQDDNALWVAKAELLHSLERLDATQQFQVIFYSSSPTVLVPRSGRSDLFRGTDVHRVEVRQQLESIHPEGGTAHMAALQAALATHPDVIFFLTDAGEPGLSPDELEDIRRRNNGGTRINCIEFGRGPGLSGRPGKPKNFLQKLAEQSDGQYRYRDVKRR